DPLPGPPSVGVKGWDFNNIDKSGTATVYNRYRLPKLKGGGWISATLVWDRLLDLQDNKVANGEYDAGEAFINPKLADLNLYLMKVGETDITKNEWSSESTLYNVEHFLYN